MTGSQIFSQLCNFLRNVIIARFLTTEDFGITVIFALLISVFTMISDISFGLFIVQSKEGDTPETQNTAHFLAVVRGVLIFLMLLVLAKPLAWLFNLNEIWPAFALLAFIPLLNGFGHYDTRRYERSLRFGPAALIEVIAQFILLLLSWPSVVMLGDYRAMLFLMICRSLIMLVVSHFLAERKYSLRYKPSSIRKFMSFGWPLLISNLLMFIILQGDKLLIASSQRLFGSSYNLSDVGYYSLAFMLAMMPAGIIKKTISRLFLPKMSKTASVPEQFKKIYCSINELTFFMGTIMMIILSYSGSSIMIFFYGEKYHDAGRYLPFLVLLWLIKLIRMPPTQAAIANGITKIVMITNFYRALAILVVIILLKNDVNLIYIACTGIVGEIIAYGINLLLNFKRKIDLGLSFWPTLNLVLFSIVSLFLTLKKPALSVYVHETIFTVFLVSLYIIITYITSLNFRKMTSSLYETTKLTIRKVGIFSS